MKYELIKIEKENKFKLSNYAFAVNGYGNINELNKDRNYTNIGRTRSSRQLAERCAKTSKQRDLLEAYRDHLDTKWVDGEGKIVYCIYYLNGEYLTGVHTTIRIIGAVCGSRETMQEICKALNEGTIVL